jgi:hypothetical protein
MADIVEFPRPDPDPDQDNPATDSHWVCNCACSTFRLMADGGIVCANCGTRSTGMDTGLWMAQLPPTDRPATPDHTHRSDDVIDLGDPRLAVERILTRFAPEEMALVAVIRRGGGIQLWGMSNFDTLQQQSWITRKLGEIGEMLRPRRGG